MDTASSWVCACAPGAASWHSSSSPTVVPLTFPASGFTLTAWVRASIDLFSGTAAFVHCKDPASTRPGFTVGFNTDGNRAEYAVIPGNGGPGNTAGLLAEGEVEGENYEGSWVHYAVMHSSSGARIFRDGVLVRSAALAYPWQGEVLECSIGGHKSAPSGVGFVGHVVYFYLWHGSLTQLELAYTRKTGTPQHASSSISVFAATRTQCQDIDECALHMSTCTGTCINTIGSFVCGPALPVDPPLVDVNECAMASHTCGANTACANTFGSYACLCRNNTAHNVSFRGNTSIVPANLTSLSSDGLSVSAWVRIDDGIAGDATYAILECAPPNMTVSIPYFTLAYSAGAKSFVYMPRTYTVNASDVKAGVWTHIALVHYKNKTLRVYRDGVQVLNSTSKYTYKATNKANCTIGSSVRGTLHNFVGELQGLYVWTRPLAHDEVARLSNAACVVFFHSCCHVGVRSNAAV
jgi:hypothetical protein